MTWQRMLQQLDESVESRYLGLIPISAVAASGHETLVVGAIERYTDRAVLSGHLRLGPDHPEHEWRDRGRPGHPVLLMRCTDELGTEYVVLPQGGGGGQSSWRFEMAIAPPVPEAATRLTLEFADVTWDARPPFPPEDLDSIAWRWRVEVDLDAQIPPRDMTNTGTR